MDIVADESVDGQVIAALRSVGHRIIPIAEELPRIGDNEVLAFAANRKEPLLTEDKDFGELVHLKRHEHAGVVVLRLSDMAPPGKVARVIMVPTHHAGELRTTFATADRRKVRSGRT